MGENQKTVYDGRAKEGREKGREEGKEEGREEGILAQKKTVLQARKIGLDDATIAKLTGLTLTDIVKIKP